MQNAPDIAASIHSRAVVSAHALAARAPAASRRQDKLLKDASYLKTRGKGKPPRHCRDRRVFPKGQHAAKGDTRLWDSPILRNGHSNLMQPKGTAGAALEYVRDLVQLHKTCRHEDASASRARLRVLGDAVCGCDTQPILNRDPAIEANHLLCDIRSRKLGFWRRYLFGKTRQGDALCRGGGGGIRISQTTEPKPRRAEPRHRPDVPRTVDWKAHSSNSVQGLIDVGRLLAPTVPLAKKGLPASPRAPSHSASPSPRAAAPLNLRRNAPRAHLITENKASDPARARRGRGRERGEVDERVEAGSERSGACDEGPLGRTYSTHGGEREGVAPGAVGGDAGARKLRQLRGAERGTGTGAGPSGRAPPLSYRELNSRERGRAFATKRRRYARRAAPQRDQSASPPPGKRKGQEAGREMAERRVTDKERRCVEVKSIVWQMERGNDGQCVEDKERGFAATKQRASWKKSFVVESKLWLRAKLMRYRATCSRWKIVVVNLCRDQDMAVIMVWRNEDGVDRKQYVAGRERNVSGKAKDETDENKLWGRRDVRNNVSRYVTYNPRKAASGGDGGCGERSSGVRAPE
ncbi:Protein of unknown function [Gryllus bimaculatus]|nr:Protein of unknown function [Gryllus bimaculatus]